MEQYNKTIRNPRWVAVVYLLKLKSNNQKLGGSTVNQGDFCLPHSSDKRNYLKFPTIMALFYVLKSCKWDFEDDKIQPNNLGLNYYLQSPNKQNTFWIISKRPFLHYPVWTFGHKIFLIENLDWKYKINNLAIEQKAVDHLIKSLKWEIFLGLMRIFNVICFHFDWCQFRSCLLNPFNVGAH